MRIGNFSIIEEVGDRWETTSAIGEFQWTLRAYCDQLSWEFADSALKDVSDSVTTEQNQCTILRLADGIALSQAGERKVGYLGISRIGGILRSVIYSQSQLCHETIGGLMGEVPLISAELLSHAHDACKRNHDEDNRSPPFALIPPLSEGPTCAWPTYSIPYDTPRTFISMRPSMLMIGFSSYRSANI